MEINHPQAIVHSGFARQAVVVFETKFVLKESRCFIRWFFFTTPILNTAIDRIVGMNGGVNEAEVVEI